MLTTLIKHVSSTNVFLMNLANFFTTVLLQNTYQRLLLSFMQTEVLYRNLRTFWSLVFHFSNFFFRLIQRAKRFVDTKR